MLAYRLYNQWWSSAQISLGAFTLWPVTEFERLKPATGDRVGGWIPPQNTYTAVTFEPFEILTLIFCIWLLLLLLLNEKIMVACCQRLRGHRTVSKVRASLLRTRNCQKTRPKLSYRIASSKQFSCVNRFYTRLSHCKYHVTSASFIKATEMLKS